jgi:two-component system, LuxR family, response regulator FixJ
VIDRMAQPAEWIVAVVDDDVGVLESTGELLESSGYRPLLYASAEEFLSSPRRDTVKFLISDIGLPGMSGLDMVRAMRRESRGLPTILITALTQPRLEEIAAELEVLRFFFKPFDGAQLVAAIDEFQRVA